MKTIQITIDEKLLQDVDTAVQRLATTRSAFVQNALELALRRQTVQELEAQHAAGYAHQPSRPDDVDEWEDEQVWNEP